MIVTKMDAEAEKTYQEIRSGLAGFYEHKRGLIAVWGKEAVPFLDGMITNDMKTLEDGAQMQAAFPNAQGRLLALVRVRRQGDRYLFETEETTREKLFQNLFRFTFAGDFFVEDRSEAFAHFEIVGPNRDVYHPNVSEKWPDSFVFELPHGAAYFVPIGVSGKFRTFLIDENRCRVISDELYETLRIEAGVPKYGIDMDDTTVVPELGLDGLISYNKGCYIGQEIIARIHFRGHVAKALSGVVSGSPLRPQTELQSLDGRPAGLLTSATYSPSLDRHIGLGYVRHEFLKPDAVVVAAGVEAAVHTLPFV